MEPIFFIKGLIIGFAMAVPIGPIGITCIRKTLTEGHAGGLIIGLGGATADLVYCSVAAFGLTLVSDVIASQLFWMRLTGGGFLLFLGIRTFLAKHNEPIISFDNKGFVGSFASTLLLALTNPMIIFAFVAAFAAFGLGNKLTTVSTSLLVLGVFAGSFLWFLILGYIAAFFKNTMNEGGLRWVNRISGAMIIVSGVVAFVSLI